MPSYYDKSGERKIPYKEDSTKGSSHMIPLNYKGDVLVQVWMDSRVLATLSRWLEKEGAYPRYMSEVVRVPLQWLVERLVESGEIKMVDLTGEARKHLERAYRVNLNPRGRGGKNTLHNQILSDRREELREKIDRGGRFYDVQAPIQPRQSNKVKFVPIPGYPDWVYPEGDIEMMNKLIEQARTYEENLKKKELAKVKHLAIDSEIESHANVTEGMSMEEINERQRKIDSEMVRRENEVDVEELKKNAISEVYKETK